MAYRLTVTTDWGYGEPTTEMLGDFNTVSDAKAEAVEHAFQVHDITVSGKNIIGMLIDTPDAETWILYDIEVI